MLPSSSSPKQKQILRQRFFAVSSLIIVGLFLVLTKCLTIRAGFLLDPGEAARAEFRIKTLTALHTEDKAKLETFAWVDRSSGSVQIPIELAMKLILPDLRAFKPKSAYPIIPSTNSSRSEGILPALSGILPDSSQLTDLASKDADECGQDTRAPVAYFGYHTTR